MKPGLISILLTLLIVLTAQRSEAQCTGTYTVPSCMPGGACDTPMCLACGGPTAFAQSSYRCSDGSYIGSAAICICGPANGCSVECGVCPPTFTFCGGTCCPPDQRCNGTTCVYNERGGPNMCRGPSSPSRGEPYNVDNGSSEHTSVDIDLGVAPAFTRHFVSQPFAWTGGSPLLGTPTPFGTSPTTASGLEWWHNFYAFVFPADGGTVFEVRSLSGQRLRFASCSAPCNAVPTDDSKSNPQRLKRIASGTFELIEGDGSRQVYTAKYVTGAVTRYFLAEVWNASGAKVATLNYAMPSGLSCPQGSAGTDTGVPYLYSIATPTATVYLYYASLNGVCVLSSVMRGATTLASYSYTNNLPGRIAQATLPEARTETYTYSASNLVTTVSTVQKFSHTYSSSMVTGDVWTGGNLSVSYSTTAGSCPVGSNCCGALPRVRTETDNAAGVGDGGNGNPGFTSTVSTLSNLGQTADPRLFEVTDSCTNADSCSAGTTRYEWSCSTPSVAGQPIGRKDKRGFYETYTWSSAGSLPELTTVKRGAQDLAGTGALESNSYTYEYGAQGQQRVATSVLPANLNAGQTVTTKYNYDTDNRLMSVITTGKTKTLAGGEITRRVGTFYRKQWWCNGSTIGSADALNRTLQVDGPCEVASDTAMACTATVFPVRRFQYYATIDLNNGQLNAEQSFPAGCGGYALTTLYSGYDAFGNPGTIVDENNVATTLVYTNGLVTQRQEGAGGPITQYQYDGNQLRTTIYPRGNREVFCYRTGTGSSGCTGGPLTNQLQWKAKATDDLAASGQWTEKLEYEYWPDGTLKWERAKTPTETRRETFFAADAHRRPTVTAFGTGTTNIERQGYDAADNLTRIGRAFAAPPPFCKTAAGTASPKCAQLEYDRANRLSELVTNPAGVVDSTSARSCLQYDSQGNLRRAVLGCPEASSCGTCLANGAPHPQLDYEVDDFGNTIGVTFPWTFNSSAPQKSEFEYDAMGNMVRYRTPVMTAATTHIENVYDQMGRLTERKRMGGTPVTLFRLGYDNTVTVTTGCTCGGAPSCPALAYGNGRLTFREDSFGKTWYVHDARGLVLREGRWRQNGIYPDCSTSNPIWVSPDTVYEYTSNGELSKIKYPHGRQVEYVYPGTGAMDRPSSVRLTTYNGSAWSALTPIIDSIAWEPFGGLRAYRLTSSTKWVDYFLAGNLESVPSGATCSALTPGSTATDGSGRLRGVFVSNSQTAGGAAPGGEIFKQVYRWSADQLLDQRTCHRAGTIPNANPLIVTYGYDNLPRVKTETEVTAGNAATTFNWSLRDNPFTPTFTTGTGSSDPFNCTQNTDYFSAPHQKDLLFSVKWGAVNGAGTCNALRPAAGKYNFTYDIDGRRTVTWDESTRWKYTTAWAQDTSMGAGIDSVFKSATFEVAGGSPKTWSYFYDAFGRRRAKLSPDSKTDEFFYDLGHQMLSDRGNNTSTSEWPEDDYIWLAGRPVAMVRGKFSITGVSTMTRQADGTGFCPRDDDEQGLCGTYAIVTDYLGKPVLTLNSSGNTSGTGSYEAFGFANRREFRWGSPHNLVQSASVTIAPPAPSPTAFDGPLRVLTSRSKYGASTVTLAGNNENGLLNGDRAHTWTNWRYASGNSWNLSWTGGSTSDYGIDVEAYEVQLKEAGTWWAWPRLRFPGHYFDKETELNENWNRYFDPRTNRYLSPEPMLQRPRWLRRAAKRGTSTPTYGYAYNNPLRYTDRTGLFGEGAAEFPWWTVPPLAGAAAQAAGEAAGVVGAGAVVVGAVGLTGMVLGVGPHQFPDPGAGVPSPRPRPARLPYFPGEPGVPPFNPAGAAGAGALVCMAAAAAVKSCAEIAADFLEMCGMACHELAGWALEAEFQECFAQCQEDAEKILRECR